MPRNKDLDLYKRIGLKIRNKRIELNISQEKLSEILDVEYVQIWRYETGKVKIPIDYLVKISTFFNINIGYFFTDLTSKKPIEKENKKLEKMLLMVKEIFRSDNNYLIFAVDKCITAIYLTLKKGTQKKDNSPRRKKQKEKSDL
jgi:transcriptional regulator with XRE-family HTH domain